MPSSYASHSRPSPNVVEEARRHWEAGRPLDAGRLLFEALPIKEQPGWAGRALEFAYIRSGIESVPQIEHVIDVASAPLRESWRWYDGREAFSTVRNIALRSDEHDLPSFTVIVLAEYVAKVTANAYAALVQRALPALVLTPRYFAPDVGSHVVAQLDHIGRTLDDPTFPSNAWETLVG